MSSYINGYPCFSSEYKVDDAVVTGCSIREVISLILSYSDNPTRYARVSKIWKDATSDAWREKLQFFDLRPFEVVQMNVRSDFLYSLCSEHQVALRRCIDEQGFEVARTVAEQLSQIFFERLCEKRHPLLGYREVENIESFRTIMLYNLSWMKKTAQEEEAERFRQVVSDDVFPSLEETELYQKIDERKCLEIEMFTKSLCQCERKEEIFQKVAVWLRDHVEESDGWLHCRRREFYFLKIVPLFFSYLNPKMIHIEGEALKGMSEQLSCFPSIKHIGFSKCNTVHFPDFSRMQNLESVVFVECPSLTQIPQSLRLCEKLKKVEIISCDSLLGEVPEDVKKKFAQKKLYSSILSQESDLIAFVNENVEKIFKYSQNVKALIDKGVKVLFYFH